MKSRGFWILFVVLSVFTVTSALVGKQALAVQAKYIKGQQITERAVVVTNGEVASPYYALCNDSSHGSGCAGMHTWCGPDRDNYAAAKADADAHKKANPSHDVTVYHVP